jgi:hypothetical protein
MKNNNPYLHPLSEQTKFVDQNNQQQEGINSWLAASIIWDSYLNGYINAIALTKEAFVDKPNKLVELTMLCKLGNEAATKQAINVIAFKLEENMDTALEGE